jgi:hypothetical protein
MEKRIADLVESQVKAWSKVYENDPKNRNGNRSRPIITISREFGAQGAALASLIAEKTGFKLWDKELLEAISSDLGSDRKFVETLDEKRQRLVEEAVAGFLTNVHTNVNYLQSLIRVVRTIEQHGNGVIVGRGANFICENRNSLHVRVVSPLKVRVSEYAKRNKIGRYEATGIIERKDNERAEFVKDNFHRDVADASNYDVVLNSDVYSLDQLAKIVLSTYTIKTGILVEKLAK